MSISKLFINRSISFAEYPVLTKTTLFQLILSIVPLKSFLKRGHIKICVYYKRSCIIVNIQFLYNNYSKSNNDILCFTELFVWSRIIQIWNNITIFVLKKVRSKWISFFWDSLYFFIESLSVHSPFLEVSNAVSTSTKG